MKNILKARKEIDKVDKEILSALLERRRIVIGVGKYKKANGIKIYQKEREVELVAERTKLAKELGVSVGLVEKIFKLILKDSRRIQRGV